MPVCGYIVFSHPGSVSDVSERLRAMPGCEVAVAENRDVLLLVTTADTVEADERLRSDVEALPGIECMVMSFGEIDPDAAPDDPAAAWRSSRRSPGLPVLPAGAKERP